ncbi:class I SAM-dependent methyltransferase [Candidatus Woesearchaeota archaeon]|nr:class I SAM-dependent methyltransferase [Candidatus Woesearchaeota archaeon]
MVEEAIKDKLKQTIETYNKIAQIYANYTAQKLLQFQLSKFISLLPEKGKILDAGCGSGRDAEYFQDEGLQVTAIDLAEGMIDEAKKRNVNAIKMDLLDLKFDKNKFDGLWSMASFHSIPKEFGPKIIKDFHKILKPDGILYIAVKEGSGEEIIRKERYQNLPIFYAFYKKEELEKLLKENDFEIIESVNSNDEGTNWVEIFAKNIKVIIE